MTKKVFTIIDSDIYEAEKLNFKTNLLKFQIGSEEEIANLFNFAKNSYKQVLELLSNCILSVPNKSTNVLENLKLEDIDAEFNNLSNQFEPQI